MFAGFPPSSWSLPRPLPGPSSSPKMHLVENKIPRDCLCSHAIMASPSGKGAQAQEAPGCGPQPLARDLVDSVDDAEGLYVAVERCPLCNTTRRRLTCAKCVQSGDFVYFDGRDRERYGSRPCAIVFSGCLHWLGGWSLEPSLGLGAQRKEEEVAKVAPLRRCFAPRGWGWGWRPEEERSQFPPNPLEWSLTSRCFWY